MSSEGTKLSSTNPDSQRRNRGRGPSIARVPVHQADSVRRVVDRIQIIRIELTGVHFSRQDGSPLPPKTPRRQATPEIAVDVATEATASNLGCLFTFGTTFEGEAPYELVARFRALYSIEGPDPLAPADIEQFAYWNALFNVWPYWREYVSSTVNRAHLGQFTVPLIKLGASSLEFQVPVETP